MRHHAEEIARMPGQGRIDAAGRFSVPYIYNRASGGDFLPLMLVVPGGSDRYCTAADLHAEKRLSHH